MIAAAEIPQIPGDPDQLLAHAAGLRVTGPALAQTGSDVHSTWQGLVPHYVAPEAGNLFAATLPVRDVAVAVGDEITVIGRALGTYADTVRPLQIRLRELRDEAAGAGGAGAGPSSTKLHERRALVVTSGPSAQSWTSRPRSIGCTRSAGPAASNAARTAGTSGRSRQSATPSTVTGQAGRVIRRMWATWCQGCRSM